MIIGVKSAVKIVTQQHEQAVQKEQEEQAVFTPYWKIPIIDDDDDDEYTIQYREYLENSSNAITPDLPTKEPDNSLSMGDEHLSTIPETESDELTKSSVEDLVPIPSESEGISDDTCDVPFCDNSPPLDVLNDHFEIFSNFNNNYTSSDDDSFENIDYVEASPPDSKLISLEEVKDDILREKLLNINLLIAKIESLNDNLTPDCVLKSPSPFPIPVKDNDSFFEKSDTSHSYSDNSLPEFETFSNHTEETSSGSTTTHADNSLPEYDLFLFEIEPDQGELTNVVMKDILGEPRVHVLPNQPTLMLDSDFIPSDDSLGSDLEISFPSRTRNKIFDPGIFYEVQSKRFLSRDTFSISLIRNLLCPVIETLLPFSSENEDQVFNPGILSSNLLSHLGKITSDFSKSTMMICGEDIPILDDCPDYEDSPACGFVHHSIFNPSHAYIWESDIRDLIDLASSMGDLSIQSYLHLPCLRIPSSEIKVYIEVLSVLWENRLPILDGSLPLFRCGYVTKRSKTKQKRTKPSTEMERERKTEAKGIDILNGPARSHLNGLEFLSDALEFMIYDLNCFSSAFKCISPLSESLPKEEECYKRSLASITYSLKELKKAQEEKDRYIDLVEKSIKDIIKDDVKSQLPQILPKEVSDFATPLIQSAINESLENSYKLDKDLFDSYGNTYSLKRDCDDKDKDEDPFVGSDRGFKKRKTSKDAELTKGLNIKESKSSSSKGTNFQSKSSGKSVQAEELEFKVADSDMPQNQEGI
ncbi:hypothetical protein Tco_0992657 [Tanacetum coccineum]|uniref:Uncharacterized protein n=1 Tax=Tanacetum coccineum TaxID=301880 RepID=A0ABQ5F3F4_9ASTR